MKKQYLNSDALMWSLTLIPNDEGKDFSPASIHDLRTCRFPTIDASVPGNFELDLYRAGMTPDPYYAQNPWAYQEYENRHLWYATTLSSAFTWDKDTYLTFEGIDTVADIFLNGQLLGHVENMFLTHEFCLEGLDKGQNELIVHIYPATIYARNYELKAMNYALSYNYESLALRKAPYMFGWDIMPRFVSGGLWKSVSVVQKASSRIEQCYLYTTSVNTEKQTAQINCFFGIHTDLDRTRDLKLTVEGVCGDSSFAIEHCPWHTYGLIPWITVQNAKLWYPRNAGEQPLYDVTAKLWKGDEVVDEITFRFGIRTVELERTSTTDADGNGEFVFRVNGKKIFCMGTNWVPLDAFPSRFEEHLPKALEMMYDCGCNIVRCWGGNAYECDAFYDFCDEKGILVWQDFAMGCAVYLQDDFFCKKIEEEAAFVIKKLRQHPSLTLWAGDNEVDLFYGVFGIRRDPNRNRLTRETLLRAVEDHDPARPYLPSSPFVDEKAFASGLPTSEEHLWGPRDYFKGNFYGTSVCHFASETGYHGCPSPDSLKKFIAPENLFPIFDEHGKANLDWICHAAEMEENGTSYSYRIPLMDSQVKCLFGTAADNLCDYAKQSQISQAEAKKYFIERFRLSKWRRTGIIWWNLLDGWPQISDAVVDWYGCKKLAYHFIKRSQAPVCMMFDEPKDGKLDLYVANDLPTDTSLCYKVTALDSDKVLSQGVYRVKGDTSAEVASIPASEDFHFLLIEWTTEDGTKGSNHYSTKTKDISYADYMDALQKAGYDQFEGFEG